MGPSSSSVSHSALFSMCVMFCHRNFLWFVRHTRLVTAAWSNNTCVPISRTTQPHVSTYIIYTCLKGLVSGSYDEEHLLFVDEVHAVFLDCLNHYHMTKCCSQNSQKRFIVCSKTHVFHDFIGQKIDNASFHLFFVNFF